jgi:hypothetical protein
MKEIEMNGENPWTREQGRQVNQLGVLQSDEFSLPGDRNKSGFMKRSLPRL